MQCSTAQALIDLQVDGSLPTPRRAELLSHLDTCPACAADLHELTCVRTLLAQTHDDAPPPGLLHDLWPSLEIAAAAHRKNNPPPADHAAATTDAASAANSAPPSPSAIPSIRKPARRTPMSAATASANTTGKIHPRWHKSALVSLLMAAVLVICYALGTQQLSQFASPNPEPSLSFADANRAPTHALRPLAPDTLPMPGSETGTKLSFRLDPAGELSTQQPPPPPVEQREFEAGSGLTTTPPTFEPTHNARALPNGQAEIINELQAQRAQSEAGGKKKESKLSADDLRRQQASRVDELLTNSPQMKSPLTFSDSKPSASSTQNAEAPTPIPAPTAGAKWGEKNDTAAPAAPSLPVMEKPADADPSDSATARPGAQGQTGARDEFKDSTEGWGHRPDEKLRHENPATTAQPQTQPTGPATPTLPVDPGRDLFAPPTSQTGAPGVGPDGQALPAQARPKIIKNGAIELEVTDFAAASQAAVKTAIRYDGFLAENKVQDLPGGAKRGTIVFRCLPENFEGLYNDLKKLGKVQNESAQAQDITTAFVDTEARIRILQLKEARMQEMLKSQTWFNRMSELLVVEQEIDKVRLEIESMQGQLRVWSNMIAYSTLRLTITEPTVPQPSGSLSIEVAGLATAKEQLDTALVNAGGKLLSGQSSKRSDGTLMGTYTVRVDLAKFSRFLTAVKTLGRVNDEQIANQPFGSTDTQANTAAPGAAAGAAVPCDLALVLYEKSAQMPGGSLRLKVDSLPAAIKKLNGILDGLRVTVVNNQTSHLAADAGSAQMQLSVRAGNFTQLLEALKEVGKVTQQNVNGDVGTITGGTAEMPAILQLTLAESDKPLKETPAGTLGLEVDSFDAAQEALNGIVKQFHIDVQEATSRKVGKQTVAAYTLGIRADQIDPAVRALEKLGTVKLRQFQGIGLGDLANTDADTIGKVVLSFEEKPETVKPTPNGALGIAVDDYPKTQNELNGIVETYKIDVESANSRKVNSLTVAQFTFAVPAAQIDAAVADLEKLGDVTVRELQGVGLGKLAHYDEDAKGHLQITIHEKPKPAETASAPTEFERAWNDSWRGFTNSLGAILRGFGVLLPWLALLLGALFLGRRWFRKAPAPPAPTTPTTPATPTSPATPNSLPTAPPQND